MAVRLALVVQSRDGLLADVAALREADRTLVEPRLLGNHGVVEIEPVARAAGLDAARLDSALGDRDRARALERVTHAAGLLGGADHVDAEVGCDQYGERRERGVVLRGAQGGGLR